MTNVQDFKFSQQRRVGFGAHFQIVLCLINYCLSNQIRFEVDVQNETYSPPGQNTWDIVFEQPFKDVDPKVTISDQFSQLPGFTSDYWHLGYPSSEREKFKDRAFIKKYRRICKNHISIKPDIAKQIKMSIKDKSINDALRTGKVLGIHKRGREHLTTGHASNQEQLLTNESVFSLIDSEIDKYDFLFLTSDEYKTYCEFKNKYGEKLIIFDDKSQYVESKVDINYLPKSDAEKIQSLIDLITEVIILSKCDKMYLMNSNVSHMALFFAKHYKFEFYDEHLIYN